MFKKSVLVVALLLIATNLWAVPTLGVSKSRHNLGSTSAFGAGQYKAGNEDEVCIFCHTPHGGTLNGPLWNRNVVASTFTHYTSVTLSSYLQGLSTTRALNPESLLCMSCHDGSTAMNSIINNSNRTGAQPNNTGNVVNALVAPGAAIGDAFDPADPTYSTLLFSTTTISDDHPISFSYYEVKADVIKGPRLHTVADAKTAGVRFFGPTGVANGDHVECSSCHDPHVNYEGVGGDAAYTPFLVASNAASALCLACHIK